MTDEIFDLFARNFPYVIRKEADVKRVIARCDLLSHKEQGALVGALLYHENTILMLAVDREYRKQGIGESLLMQAEALMKEKGYREVSIGASFSYLTPGVPRKEPFFASVTEVPLAVLWEDHSAFFLKRGYLHAWDCDCFDLICTKESDCKVNTTPDNFHFGYAVAGQKEAVCHSVAKAHASFETYYQKDALYKENESERVLCAFDGERIVGALILSLEKEKIGTLGCVAVLPPYRGKGIATALVAYATKALFALGAEKNFVGYTYSGLERLYGKSGYRISSYYLMGKKEL